MLAKVVIIPLNQPPELYIEHNDERLIFNVSRFTRKPFEKYDVFEHLNAYWRDLPMPTQNALFELYRQVALFYDDHHTREELKNFMAEHAVAILDIHNLIAIDDWISFKSNIIIPNDYVAEYIDNVDSNKSRDKTYTRLDYKQLLGLSLALHSLVPIWGEYVNIIRHETGNDHKEKFAFQLIQQSPIMTSPAMVKLRHYIQALTIDKHTPDNILRGISSEDFVYWLLALITVKRLCVASMQVQIDGTNIITYIYKFIIQRLQARDNGFEDSYKEKRYDVKGPGGQENKISTLEKYKIKSDISPGEIVEIEFSVRNIYNVASKLTSTMTPEKLQPWLDSSQVLLEHDILDPQLIILGWVLKPVMSPDGLQYLPKESLVNLIAVAQAVLWLRGYQYLALLMGSYAMISEQEMIISPVDSKMQLPKEFIKRIERIYPFTRPCALKRKGDTRPNNIVLDSIDQLTDDIAMYSWRMTAAIQYIQEEFNTTGRKFLIKPDIKTYIAELVLNIGERSWI